MNQRMYILVYNRPTLMRDNYGQPYSFDPVKLHNFILSQADITDWWHFLESAYLFVSPSNLATLEQKFNHHFQGILILIMPVYPDGGGLLPKEAWDWINSKKNLR